MSFTGGGAARWMSPELLDPERFGIIDYRPTKQSDYYALGMVVYEVRRAAIFPTLEKVGFTYRQVLCGNPPYWEIASREATIYTILEGVRPKKPEAAESIGFTEGLWGVVQQCWLVDASARPDVRNILSHLNHATWSWQRRRMV